MIYLFVGAAVLVLGFALWHRFRREPSGWFAGPIIGGKNYSPGASVNAAGSFDFPLAKSGVHYVTKVCRSLVGVKGIRLHYRIDAAPGVSFIASSDGVSSATGPTVYLQRHDDDWSGVSKYEAYRWWVATRTPLEAGEYTIDVSFDDPWGSVEGQSGVVEFAAARADVARIGFTFGGGGNAGHGAFATGHARFELISFDLVGIE